ncbi:MAG: oxygenase MpaB family protein [Propionibacteriales bacterium]|nr:oxygenase MpaB family protein [Propionibacteriales bacterium]
MTATLPDPSTAAGSRPAPERPRRLAEPGGLMWDSVGLVTFSFTSGSAFLLQVMEPSIAAVVDQNSTFRTDPIGRGLRSLASVMMWVYADEESLAEVERLREMHSTLEAVDANGVRHTALSSGPWAWVLLTGVHAFTEGAKYFGKGRLDRTEVDEMYQEMKQLMRGFKVAEKEIPGTYDEFVAFFETKIVEQLDDNVVAQDFLTGVRHPGPPLGTPRLLTPVWRALTNPLGYVQHLSVVGTLPQAARQKLGVRWTRKQEAQLKAFGWLVARAVPLLPERLRYFPIAYEARRLERNRAALRRVIDLRPV